MRRQIRSVNEHRLSKVKDWLSVLRAIIEILAILVAGSWAYTKYIKIERHLEIRNSSTGDLNWTSLPTKDVCLGTLGVTVKNIGTAPFFINKVTLQVWSVDISNRQNIQSYFSPLDEGERVLVLEKEFSSAMKTSLLGSYAVDEENHNDFSFIVNNKPNLIYYFNAIITGPNVKILEGRWSFACDSSPQTEKRY